MARFDDFERETSLELIKIFSGVTGLVGGIFGAVSGAKLSPANPVMGAAIGGALGAVAAPIGTVLPASAGVHLANKAADYVYDKLSIEEDPFEMTRILYSVGGAAAGLGVTFGTIANIAAGNPTIPGVIGSAVGGAAIPTIITGAVMLGAAAVHKIVENFGP